MRAGGGFCGRLLARVFACLFVVTAPAAARAAEEVLDVIELDGVASVMQQEPLDSQLAARRSVWRARWLKEVEQTGTSPKGCEPRQRGYQAFWQIKGGELQLLKVTSDPCLDLGTPMDVREFSRNDRIPVTATWYTGALFVPRGKPVAIDVDGEHAQKYAVLIVQRGKVLSRTAIEKRPWRPTSGPATR